MHTPRHARGPAAVALSGAMALPALAGAPIPAEFVLAEGDAVNGGTVTTVNAPFTDGNGNVGLVANVTYPDTTQERIIWYDGAPVFFASEALPDVLTGGESTMDVSNTGGFIYSPSVNGNDGSWSHLGAVLVETDPAPGFPGLFISFASRVRMDPVGNFYVVSGLTDVQGGGTDTRLMYRISPDLSSYEPLFVGGETVIGGFVLDATAGVDFDYGFSDDASHLINVFDLETGSSLNNIAVVVDGAIVLQEGGDAGSGEAWSGIDNVAVNNAGDWIVTGDTNGAIATDEFVAYNGAIVLREGDLAGGVPITGSVNAASLNDNSEVVVSWGSGAAEALYFFDATADPVEAAPLLRVGDQIEVGGELFTVDNLSASGVVGPGLDFQEDGFVNLEVELLDTAGGEFAAIVRLAVPGGASCPGDLTGDDQVGSEDLNVLLGAFGQSADGDLDDDGDTNSTDLNILLANFGRSC